MMPLIQPDIPLPFTLKGKLLPHLSNTLILKDMCVISGILKSEAGYLLCIQCQSEPSNGQNISTLCQLVDHHIQPVLRETSSLASGHGFSAPSPSRTAVGTVPLPQNPCRFRAFCVPTFWVEKPLRDVNSGCQTTALASLRRLFQHSADVMSRVRCLPTHGYLPGSFSLLVRFLCSKPSRNLAPRQFETHRRLRWHILQNSDNGAPPTLQQWVQAVWSL